MGVDLAGVADPSEQPGFDEVEYRGELVHRALQLLRVEFPATIWKAFEKYVLEDRPAEQVAAELGIRPGTVYAAKSRVLARLRQELAGLLD
jgi:RNA polymerase sigma-70 factor (ECF subfamily)